MPSKEEILTAIRRESAANGGTPPGYGRFGEITGIKRHMWSGIYWAKWSDALAEAGFKANTWGPEATRSLDSMAEAVATLARTTGHWPSGPEIDLAHRADPFIPLYSTMQKRVGNRPEQVALVHDWAARNGWADVAALLQPSVSGASVDRVIKDGKVITGYVYLMLSGRHYKIGQSNHVGRRAYEVAIQLPERLEVVHEISTDDPEGIEAYWHHRFASKRANGEWFDLAPDDVATFKRRTYM